MNFPVNSCLNCQRLTILLLSLMVVGTTVGIIVPAGPGWDFANFYDAGSKVGSGQVQDLYDPYSLIRGNRAQGTLQFVGTPISAFLYVPLSYFSSSAALIIFKIQNTLAYFVALLLLYFHYRKLVEDSLIAQSQFAATFAFLSLIYQPFWTVYRVGGQSMPTVFLLLTLALLSHTTGRMFWSSLCLVLVVFIKPAFLATLAFLAIVSGGRFFCYTAGLASFAGGVSVIVMGWPVHQEFLAVVAKASKGYFPWFYNSSLYVFVDNLRVFFGVESEAASSVGFTITTSGVRVLLVLTAIYVVARGRIQRWTAPARRHFHFLMAVSFCLLLAPILWEHYLSALFIPLAYIVASQRYFSRRAMVVIGSIFVLAVWQNLILVNFLRYNFMWDSLLKLMLVGLLKSGPLLLFLIFLLRYQADLLQSYAAPAWKRGSLAST